MQVTLIVTEEAKHSLTQRYNQVTAQPLNRRVSLQSDDPTKVDVHVLILFHYFQASNSSSPEC